MVVDNRAAGRLVGALARPAAAGGLQQKRSFLEGKLGQVVGSPKLDARRRSAGRRRGFGSRLFDGEGIAARRMPVFEDGVLKSYYIDTYYGRKLEMAPTTGGSVEPARGRWATSRRRRCSPT